MKQITSTQERVLNSLPATVAELADEFDITTSTIRDHLKSLRDAGYTITKRQDGKYHVMSEPRQPSEYSRPVRTSGQQAQITRRANEWLDETKEWIDDLLSYEDPAIADGGLEYEPGHEDAVFHRTDDHIGALGRDEWGNLIFDDKIAVNRIETVFQNGIDLLSRQERAGTVFDTIHVGLGGDNVTGEGIFEGQPWETCLTLDKQVELGAKLYFEQIATLAKKYPSVQVVCQPGNHGELRVKSPSHGANADIILYAMLDHMVRVSSLTNVTFIRNESTNFTNFSMRGHRAHIRHGQDSLFHIGTSSGKQRWQAWLVKHQFDVAYRGHFHEWRIEPIMSRPVIMSGSICPPGDFEESLAVWSEPAGTLHGVSDNHALTWFYPLYFDK